MISTILLALFSLSMLSSAVAFFFYVPVLNIIAAWAVVIGFAGAFTAGFFSGRGARRVRIPGRNSAPVIPIDSPIERRMVL